MLSNIFCLHIGYIIVTNIVWSIWLYRLYRLCRRYRLYRRCYYCWIWYRQWNTFHWVYRVNLISRDACKTVSIILITAGTGIRTIFALASPPIKVHQIPTLQFIYINSVFIIYKYPSWSPCIPAKLRRNTKIIVILHKSVISYRKYDKRAIRKQ